MSKRGNKIFRQHVLDQAYLVVDRYENDVEGFKISTVTLEWADDQIWHHSCKVKGCKELREARDMCMAHYGRWARGAEVNVPINKRTIPEPDGDV